MKRIPSQPYLKPTRLPCLSVTNENSGTALAKIGHEYRNKNTSVPVLNVLCVFSSLSREWLRSLRKLFGIQGSFRIVKALQSFTEFETADRKKNWGWIFCLLIQK